MNKPKLKLKTGGGCSYVCGKCGDIIQSKHRHDMVYCKCGECSVDGGAEYSKITYYTVPPTPYKEPTK